MQTKTADITSGVVDLAKTALFALGVRTRYSGNAQLFSDVEIRNKLDMAQKAGVVFQALHPLRDKVVSGALPNLLSKLAYSFNNPGVNTNAILDSIKKLGSYPELKEVLAALHKDIRSDPQFKKCSTKNRIMEFASAIIDSEYVVEYESFKNFMSKPTELAAKMIASVVPSAKMEEKLRGKILEFLPAPLEMPNWNVSYDKIAVKQTLEAKRFDYSTKFSKNDFSDRERRVLRLLAHGRYDKFDNDALHELIKVDSTSKISTVALAAMHVMRPDLLRQLGWVDMVKEAFNKVSPESRVSKVISMLKEYKDFLESSGGDLFRRYT